MKTITRDRLRALLADLKGARPLSVTCLTETKARSNPFGTIMKAAKHQAFTGADYATSVENRREKEHVYSMVPFQSRPRKWGKRVAPCLVSHETAEGTRWYLPVHIIRAGRALYLVRKDARRLVAVPHEAIAAFLPPPREGASRQLVEKEVQYRDIALDSITAIALDGERYRVRA